jgi:chromosome segregation ATPase
LYFLSSSVNFLIELFSETNPELAYYKSSLESERNRRKQLETLIDVQQQRLTEAESELIQLRANDHKKTLCMKQLEQMIPNVVDEWKQKETDYKTKLNHFTQQIKQIEQINRDKIFSDKQQFDEQLNEKNLIIDRLTRDNERIKQDYESVQSKTKQSEQRIQQLTKDSEQVRVLVIQYRIFFLFIKTKQRWSTLESDLRNEIKTSESRLNDLQSELDKKQQEIEQMLRDQHKLNNDHQIKIRQLENELDEQRRETVRKKFSSKIYFFPSECIKNGTRIT